jgi:predicted type IV restriction endonuclease
MEKPNEIAPAIHTKEEIAKEVIRQIIESLTAKTSQPIEAQTQKTLGMNDDDEDYD